MLDSTLLTVTLRPTSTVSCCSEDSLIAEAAMSLSQYTVNSTQTPCLPPVVDGGRCLVELATPRTLTANVGVYEAVIVLEHIGDSFGLDLMCYVVLPYQQFLLELFSWHAVSAGVVIGAIGAFAALIIWAAMFFSFKLRPLQASESAAFGWSWQRCRTCIGGSWLYADAVNPLNASAARSSTLQDRDLMNRCLSFRRRDVFRDKTLMALLTCSDKQLEKREWSESKAKMVFRTFCNLIEYGTRLWDTDRVDDNGYFAHRLTVQPSRRKDLLLSLGKSQQDAVVLFFFKRAASFLPGVLSATTLLPAGHMTLFPSTAHQLGSRLSKMLISGTLLHSGGLDPSLSMKAATYEAART